MSNAVPLRFPKGGVSERMGYEEQPPDTCVDAQNVRTFDSLTDRARGGQRSGISKHMTATPTGTSDPIQNINQVSSISVEEKFEELAEPVRDWVVDVNANILGDMNGVAVDEDRNIYVVGKRDAGNTRSVWKYDPTGTTLLAEYDTGADTYGVSVRKIIDYNTNTYSTYVAVAGERSGAKSVWILDDTLTLRWSGDTGGAARKAMVFGYIALGKSDPSGVAVGVRTAAKSYWQFDDVGAVTTSLDVGDDLYDICENSAGRFIMVGKRNTGWVGSGGSGASVWKNKVGTLHAFDTGDDVYSCAYDPDNNRVVVGGVRNPSWQGTNGTHKSVFAIADLGDGSNTLGTLGTTPPTWTFGPATCLAVCVDFDSNVYGGYPGSYATATAFKLDQDGVEAWTYLDDKNLDDSNSVASDNQKNLIIGHDRGATVISLQKLITADFTSLINVPRQITHLVVQDGTVRAFDGINDLYHDIADGVAALSTGGEIRSAEAYSKCFFVDGTNYKFYDPITNAMIPWIPTAGALPDDPGGDGTADNAKGARKITRWGGRLVVYGTSDDPHNWFMSAIGDPFDWDYAPAASNSSQAISGNNAGLGAIGQVIRVVIPYDDQLCFFGCDAEIWKMIGNPADGGELQIVTRSIGIAHDRGWCIDDQGYIYFYGSDGIVYRLAPGGIPEPLSVNAIHRRLLDFDLSDVKPHMEWNHREQGVHLFLHSATTNATHRTFWWDRRNSAWWPDELASTKHPSYVFTIDGDLQNDRRFLLGCQDGAIRFWDEDASDDDGTAIESYVWLGPMGASIDRELRVQGFDAVLGAGSGDLNYEVYVGDTAEAALDEVPALSGTFAAGRNNRVNDRARGAVILFRLFNDTLASNWSIESIGVHIRSGAEVRQR